MKKRMLVGVMLAAAIVVGTTIGGCSGGAPPASSDSASSASVAMQQPPTAPTGAPAESSGAKAASPAATNQGASAATTQKMIVVTASMNVDVSDVAKALDSMRSIATATGSDIADLRYTSGAGSGNAPLSDGAAASAVRGPANAVVTLRIPAAHLADAERRVTALGTVTSQSSTQSDVTQQHIDMSARLGNLRAEESRLRALMDRAGKVSELLEVQQELSRVQGDIESMTAQLAYLEQQAAMSTLSVNLSNPGQLVRPASASWGFAASFTLGVQAAAAVARTLITGIIGLSPIIVLGLLVWALIWLLRRRASRRALAASSPQPPPPSEGI